MRNYTPTLIRPFLTILLVCTVFNLQGQVTSAYLQQNAINISCLNNLSDSIYHLLSPYQVIMVGEMHGTNEPANFVTGLANLLTDKGDSVQLGLEIPPAQITNYLSTLTNSAVYKSDFFLKPTYESGRESIAWADIIARFTNNNKVKIFFFDANDAEIKAGYYRDSMMYLKIKQQIKQHPNWKMITLSGNIHNITSPQTQHRKATMALLLLQDSELNLSTKICSINHYYPTGSALCNYGDGLKLHEVSNYDNKAYISALGYNNYLVLMPQNSISAYSAVLFTRKATASQMVKNK